MAKKSMILKQQAPAKFSTRKYNRCKLCGRPHAYLRDYGVCRVCFRTLAYKGEIPGVPRAKAVEYAAILRWPGSAYTKYAIALPPRLAKKSLICFRHTWSKRYSFAWSDEKQLVPTGPAPLGIQDGERSLVIKHRRSSDGA